MSPNIQRKQEQTLKLSAVPSAAGEILPEQILQEKDVWGAN
jgi:hypothetical protein